MYSSAGIWKKYCHILNQHSSNCKILRKKTKMSKFGTKNALFGVFWAGIWKQYCHIWNQHPQSCLISKFFEIMKMPKFGSKNALFGYFRARTYKNYYHIWNHHPQICQKWVFNSNSEFWYRVRFSEGLGSGPSLLYKVCPLQSYEVFYLPKNKSLFCLLACGKEISSGQKFTIFFRNLDLRDSNFDRY